MTGFLVKKMANMEVKGYSLDDVSKGLGAVAIGSYILGYLVLSYYLSKFGFNPFSPFRSRVLETGACALILFCMPTAIAMAVASISSRGMRNPFPFVMRLLCIPILCEMVCGLPGFIDELPNSIQLNKFHGSRWLEIAILCVIPFLSVAFIGTLFIILRWIWRNYHKRKFFSIAVLCSLAGVFIALGVKPDNSVMHRRIFLWLLATSIIACLLIGSTREKAAQRKIDAKIKEIKAIEQDIDGVLHEIKGAVELPAPDFDLIESQSLKMKGRLAELLSDVTSHTSTLRLETLLNLFGSLIAFGYSVCAIAVYANCVFPYIPLKLGGGELVSITVYQTGADQTWRVMHGEMLDQSDQGLFLLPRGHNKGLFIPKERIEAISFADGPTDLDSAIK
jgi:hypothetical protein